MKGCPFLMWFGAWGSGYLALWAHFDVFPCSDCAILVPRARFAAPVCPFRYLSVEKQGELRSLFRGGAGGDVASVQVHNLFTEAQAYAAAALLGGEEWDEYFVKYFWEYAGAVVCDGYGYCSCFGYGRFYLYLRRGNV